jgi:hypothetical protein
MGLLVAHANNDLQVALRLSFSLWFFGAFPTQSEKLRLAFEVAEKAQWVAAVVVDRACARKPSEADLSKSSLEQVAAGICIAADEFCEDMLERNFLQLAPGSLAHTRFVVGSRIFAYLMCQNMVLELPGKDSGRSLQITRLITEKCISDLVRKSPLPITELVIWQEELEIFNSSESQNSHPAIEEIFRELYVTRMSKMMRDDMEGLRE